MHAWRGSDAWSWNFDVWIKCHIGKWKWRGLCALIRVNGGACKISRNIASSMHAWRRLGAWSSCDGRTQSWNFDA